MKIKIMSAALALILVMTFTGCTAQEAAKNYGGSMTIELEPGVKLEEITWKDDSLWYLTRPMHSDEEPETHVFQQSSSYGIFEGTVTIIESKNEREE